MKTFILVYDSFAHFEVILSALFLKEKSEIITVGINKNIVTSTEGFRVMPHITINEVVNDEVDVFIIPGGEPEKLYKCDELYSLISDLHKLNKVIGAVCAGPIHLAKANILKGKRFTTSLNTNGVEEFKGAEYVDQNVVIDGNIITAKASGYVDFAIEIGKIMNIYKDEDDLTETIDFFKFFKSQNRET